MLHDAGMDIRAPTHELIRAHAILRARRRVARAAPGWALSPAGLETLRGRARESDAPEDRAESGERDDDGDDEEPAFERPLVEDDEFAELFASVDAAIAQANRTLAGEPRPAVPRDSLVYDLDWDEDARLAEWRATVDQTGDLPPMLAAALAHEAWSAIEPLQRAPGLGRLLAAALLQDRGKTLAHLPCLAEGARAIPRERISRPLLSAGMIGKALGVTPRAAQNLVAELGLREVTGRTRYRAWGIL